jgi:predicted ArsR family transcriptional regulator
VIHRLLLDDPEGLTRSQLHDLLHRNRPAAQIKEALEALREAGRAESRTRKSMAGGRPAELWTAITAERSDSPVLARVA